MNAEADIDTAADDLALFTKLKGWVTDSMNRHGDWYTEAKECFSFVAGRSVKGDGQWPGTSYQDMIDSGRQPIEFNRVGPIVDAICGLEVNNRQEVRYLPRSAGDGEVNERLSSLGEWARDEANAEDEESDMFRNAVICGRGATETRISFDEEPTGKIVIDCLDPIECGVDPASRKAGFADRRYSWRIRDMASDEAKAMFEGLEATALDASWARTINTVDGGEGNKTDYPDETRSALRDDRAPKTCRVVLIEWWEFERRMLVAQPAAPEPVEMSVQAWEAVAEEAEAQGWTAEPVNRRRYRKAFLGRAGVLEATDIEGFQIQWTTGRYDRNKGYHYGVVRPMRDPQMLSNKTLSQVLHILNTNAKGGLIIEQGAFRNARDSEKDWSDPSKTIVVNEGGLAKIKDRTAPQMPQSLVHLQEFSLTSIRDVTGANVEMMGMADREQAASLEYQRRQSAMTILASLFNGLRRYRKMQGRTLLQQLKMLPTGVLVRVLVDPNDENADKQWVPFAPEEFGLGPNTRFDVIVDEMPSSPNQKEATWAAIQPFMGNLPPSAIPIALEASPLPETVAKRLGEAITGAAEGPQVPPEVQEAIQQGQARIEELEGENAQLRDKGAIDAGKLQVQARDSETKRIKVMTDIAQPGEMDELRAMVAQLAQSQAALIQRLGGQ